MRVKSDSAGSGQSQIVRFCEHDNEPSSFIEVANFITSQKSQSWKHSYKLTWP
jgi:hypothetical protein